jgi:hypothetical protein
MISLLKKAILFTSVALCSFSIKAQDKKSDSEGFNDYVITSKGDTVICKVNIPLFSGPNYQTAQMSEVKKIKVGEIKEYYVKQRKIIFRAIIIEGQKRFDFLPVVENGKISLYQEIYTSQYTAAWCVSKGTDTAFRLKQNDYLLTSRKDRKGKFENMLKDKPVVYDKFIADNKFTYEQLRDIVHLYNTTKP